jgi:hypothetical protein
MSASSFGLFFNELLETFIQKPKQVCDVYGVVRLSLHHDPLTEHQGLLSHAFDTFLRTLLMLSFVVHFLP